MFLINLNRNQIRKNELKRKSQGFIVKIFERKEKKTSNRPVVFYLFSLYKVNKKLCVSIYVCFNFCV